jgi:hypothetical protein
MKICDFTKPELDKFRKECNFTEIERQCFDLKAKGLTNYQLAMELNISDSTVSSTMKSIRAKITAVSEEKTKKQEAPAPEAFNPMLSLLMDFIKKLLADSPFLPESHTTKEWLELPDRISVKDKLYVVTDYRTDDNSPSVPRLKYGDGVTLISKLPFCTAAITDNDVLWWDLKAQKIQ